MNDEKINLALEIIENNLAKLIKELAYNNSNAPKLQEKIETLEKIKDEVYRGNIKLSEKIIQKHKEGIL